MEQIVVPQFIDAEDTIIGPITVRQFIEMMVGGLLVFIFYKIFDFSLFAVTGLLTIVVTLVIAFIRINGQPFHYFLLNFIETIKSPKLKIWKRQVTEKDIRKEAAKEIRTRPAPPMLVRQATSSSRLSELALIVDTGGVYRGENNFN
jgi:hypothetical protein